MNSVAECSSICGEVIIGQNLKKIEKSILQKNAWILSVIEKDMLHVAMCILSLKHSHSHRYMYIYT